MHPCGSSSSLLFLLPISYVFFYSLTSVFSDDGSYTSCNTPLECGNQKDIGYPFWGSTRPKGCGHLDFELDCSGEYPEMAIKETKYRVLEIDNTAYTIRIVRKDYADNLCPSSLETVAFDFSHFVYDVPQATQNITLYYKCANEITDKSWLKYSSNFGCSSDFGYYVAPYIWWDPSLEAIRNEMRSSLESCQDTVNVTVTSRSATSAGDLTYLAPDTFKTTINNGFTVKWWTVDDGQCSGCQKVGGQCGNVDGKFVCYCPDNNKACDEFQRSLPGSKGGPQRRKMVLALSFCLAGLLVAFVLAIFIYKTAVYLRKKKAVICLRNKRTIIDHHGIEAFIENNRSLAPQRFNYLDVKKMTNSFADIVGKGGFGSVYRGKLPDGRLVAVKVLNTLKETNGEDFINEVASMSRTSHVNIVCLLGFCYERTKRALIYEFIPNGSLDHFIYDKGITLRIKFETLEKIAVGVARGLEYLHRGCNTRIVHFDIKPHNILLDDDFCPKISDFGLAKLNQTKESVMSMLDTRGTVGYIAPEVFSRNFGKVSHKSDVYSYGMMVLEMVGGRRNFDRGVSHTSEMYFPDWIYKQLEPDENLQLCGDLTEEEEIKARKMIIVGLWCIQTYPQNRPAMSKVVEMLEGSLELLQIPPKPVLSSPNESPEFLLATSSSVDI